MKKIDLDQAAEKLEVTISNQKIVLTYPLWGEIEDVQAKGDDLGIEEIKEFLVTCGLQHEDLKKFQLKQVLFLFEELVGAKKS